MTIQIWVFNDPDSKFPGGVFADKEIAVKWIMVHKLTGVLTLYPVNEGVYDWAIKEGIFRVSKEKEKTPGFIGGFSTAAQEHYHYADGMPD